ncbi:pentatricopeptide repeat-containing protein At4g38010-like [Tasmannia lanceolata]|uniref:pentatricopeptide repeat-containing protein At4g38010-like n=1 Tax=Tasmannia lanceolata TaxID=3420 RepID=UPI004062D8AF
MEVRSWTLIVMLVLGVGTSITNICTCNTDAGVRGDTRVRRNPMPDSEQGTIGSVVLYAKLFNEMPIRDIVSWNCMIYGYAKCGNMKAARELFDQTPLRDVVTWTIIVNGYAKCGKMPERDIFSWNIMIDAYASVGSINIAQELFDAMSQRDVISWNALIAGYRQNCQAKEAIELFHRMQMVGEKPDCSTLAIVLSAIADLGLFAQGRWIPTYVDKNKFSLDGIVGVAIIDMYCKCGNVDIALGIFDCITHRNIDHWNSMISGLAIHGCDNAA